MIVFKSFLLGDCEDPEIYAAHPIWEWQQTEAGKWVMEHAIETPSFRITSDPLTYGYRVDVYGKLEGSDLTYFKLKWSDFK
jgi:hypothetical protein